MLPTLREVRQATAPQDRPTYLIAYDPLLKTWIEYAALLALVMIVVMGVLMLIGAGRPI